MIYNFAPEEIKNQLYVGARVYVGVRAWECILVNRIIEFQ